MKKGAAAVLILFSALLHGCGNELGSINMGANNTSPIGRVAGGSDTLVVAQGDYATADFSASSDPDGDTLSHSISLKSAPSPTVAVEFDDVHSAKPKFVAEDPGDYEVEDAISDGRATVKVVKKMKVVAPALSGFAPANGSSNISTATSLFAVSNGATTKCDFYLGNPTIAKVASQVGTVFSPQTFLQSGVTHYWMMSCRNGVGPTFPVITDVMSFTTATGNSPPTVTIAASALSAPTGSTIGLTVAGVDPEGSALAYLTVATGPSGTAVVTDPTGTAPTLFLSTAGTYTVTAKTNDGAQDSQPATVLITAESPASSVTGTITVSSIASGQTGTEVVMDVGCETEGDGSASWVVSVVDAQGNDVAVSNPSSSTVSFTASAGTYTAYLECSSGSSTSIITSTVSIGGDSGGTPSGSSIVSSARFWQDPALGGASWNSSKMSVTKAGQPWQVNLSWFPFTVTQGAAYSLGITCTGTASTVSVELKNEYDFTPYATGSFICNGNPQTVPLAAGMTNPVPGGTDPNTQLSLNFGATVGEYTLSSVTFQ